jgi:poly(A) polymerase
MKPDLAVEIVRRLRDQGHTAYLVGGCVRDMVMKIEPSDYDIATSATPETVMRIFPHTEAIGAQFGVILVVHRGHPFEVATFRSDEAYVDGRRPTGVVFTDAQTDVLRRDFTINGLLYDPLEDRVLDFVSGVEDIRNRVVRAIGDPHSRFAEDKLRMLRAIRFAARFEYSIDPATWEALAAMAAQIVQVSAERISAELQRILTEGHASLGFQLLQNSGLLPQILPEVQWNAHLERSLKALDAPEPPPFQVSGDFGLGVLLHEVPERDVRSIAFRLKLSRSEMQHVIALNSIRKRVGELRALPLSGQKRFFRQDRVQDYLELARICAVADNREPAEYNFAADLQRRWQREEIWPAPLLSGEDLIAMGFVPGPLFKEILTRIEDEQLEGRLGDREAAIAFVNSTYTKVRS